MLNLHAVNLKQQITKMQFDICTVMVRIATLCIGTQRGTDSQLVRYLQS